MPDSPDPPPDPALVALLRRAGCVFAEDEARLIEETAASPAQAAELAARRADGLPLELVLGWAEFCGLRIAVTPGVFIPRRRTEFLARQAIALGRRAGGPQVVVDLCCGSGAIGLAILNGLRAPGPATGPAGTETSPAGPSGTDGGGHGTAGNGTAGTVCTGGNGTGGRSVELYAADVDPAAAACARANIGAAGRVYQGDLYDALPASLRGRVTLLTANVPYVPTAEIALLPPEARDHEPPATLDGGADGLDLLRRVASGAPSWLAPGGWLLIETSDRQLALAVQAVAAAGLRGGSMHDPELGATIVAGTWPASLASRA
jgi:release factor glutamine methyltransferase